MDPFYPILALAEWIASVIGFPQGTLAEEVLSYFIYDSVKILILLAVIIYGFSIIRTFLSPERVRKILSHRLGIGGNVIASTIGIFTPFCSCSAVPLFIGFVESGVPLGVTFSYLVAAPMINEIAAILLFGMFGWEVALLYIASGFVIAVVSGVVIGKMGMEKHIEGYVYEMTVKKRKRKKLVWRDRSRIAYEDTISIVKKVFPFILIGVAVGALIHGYAPENFLYQIAGRDNPLAVPAAVAIGVPLYSNAAGMIPIVSSLIEKGLPLGTALAFMMAVTALSFPEMIILRKVLKPKLLALFVGIVTLGIIFTGYLFNAVI
jgi:hypothetical protein